MQTFLPYPDILQSVQCLDYRRLGKQRVEAMQTYNQITRGSGGYPHHPVNDMWREYPSALAYYHNACIMEWCARGYKNTMEYLPIDDLVMPYWLGNEKLHLSHQSNLMRKDPVYYGQFDWQVPDNLPYIWINRRGGAELLNQPT